MRYLLIKDRVVVNIVESDGVPVHTEDHAIEDYGLQVGDVCSRPYLIKDIEALEAKQPRALREAILTGDKSRIESLDDEIASLRAQL